MDEVSNRHARDGDQRYRMAVGDVWPASVCRSYAHHAHQRVDRPGNMAWPKGFRPWSGPRGQGFGSGNGIGNGLDLFGRA